MKTTKLTSLGPLVPREALEQAVERECHFNCDAESSCQCAAHVMYHVALKALAHPVESTRVPSAPNSEKETV